MRTPNYTTQFERDLRLLQRRGKDIEKLKEVLTALVNEAHVGVMPVNYHLEIVSPGLVSYHD